MNIWYELATWTWISQAQTKQPCVVDVFDRERLAAVMREAQPDVVIHQLTDLSEKDCASHDFSATTRIREIDTRNQVDAARAVGVRRIIAQSVAAWIYAPGEGPADESIPLKSEAPSPLSPGHFTPYPAAIKECLLFRQRNGQWLFSLRF